MRWGMWGGSGKPGIQPYTPCGLDQSQRDGASITSDPPEMANESPCPYTPHREVRFRMSVKGSHRRQLWPLRKYQLSPWGSTTKIPAHVKELPSIWYPFIQLEEPHSQFLSSLALPHQKWRKWWHTQRMERGRNRWHSDSTAHERKQEWEVPTRFPVVSFS